MAGTTAAVAASQWLTPFDRDPAAIRIAEYEARLRADGDLVLRLALSGYTGPEWDEAAGRLAAYGLRVLTAWILDGTIRPKCRDKGWAGPWDERCRTLELASDLAADTVTVALGKFRASVLIEGRWSPNGGASLSTFFIGQCLLRWANVYRNWARQQKNQIGLPAPGWAQKEPQLIDSTGQVLDRMHLEQLAPEGSLRRSILRYQDAGYSWDEISALTGKSVPSVRGVIRRLQESAKSNPHAKEAS